MGSSALPPSLQDETPVGGRVCGVCSLHLGTLRMTSCTGLMPGLGEVTINTQQPGPE